MEVILEFSSVLNRKIEEEEDNDDDDDEKKQRTCLNDSPPGKGGWRGLPQNCPGQNLDFLPASCGALLPFL